MANPPGYMGGGYPQYPPPQMPNQGGMYGGGEMPYPSNEQQHPYPHSAQGQPPPPPSHHRQAGGQAPIPRIASQPAYAYPPPSNAHDDSGDGGVNMAGALLSANPNAFLGMMNANVKKTWLFRVLHAIEFSLYFEVDTEDVKQRLVAIFWPSQKYFRKVAMGAGDFSDQRERGQHPDLYIPMMALITHVILCSIARGLQGKFHPDFTADSFSRTTLVWLVDVFFCKVFLTTCGIKLPYLDLTALIGSFFVPLSVLSAVSLASRGKLFWYAYAPLAFGLFIYLIRAISKHSPKKGTRANNFIAATAAFQLLMLVVLSPSSKWNPVRKYTVGHDQG